MKDFYVELIENDLNPYLLFTSTGKIKSYNKEAEFLLNFVGVKELFELAVSNASQNFGFNQKYISLKYNKQSYYAILVGYANEDEIALRLYKVVSNKTQTINNTKLKLMNIFNLIDLSKQSVLLNSSLVIDEVYDISIPELKININDFLLCLNDCFLYFENDEEIKLRVQIKTGEYEVINNIKYKIIEIAFVANKLIKLPLDLEQKASNANANIFYNQNTLRLEVPLIL